MTSLTSSGECVYLIRDDQTGLHKIGMTGNWARRSRELQVGRGCTAVRLVACPDAQKWERVLHAQFRHKRLPQSEWFRITEDEALPKMQWLVEKLAWTRHRSGMIVGSWKRAQAGHFYRRRKSSNGHWYTETKTSEQIEQDRQQWVAAEAVAVERMALRQSREEPGFWPVPGGDDVQWQERDPRLAIEKRNSALFLLGIAATLVAIGTGHLAWLVVLVPFIGVLACSAR